jgi:hypothetical protein
LLADLDLATRRAAALHRRLLRGGDLERWPEPLRTYQGGLRLLDVRLGSFDLLATVWGTLVSVAGSSPIAVASLIALAWDVGRPALRAAGRWIGAPLAANGRGRPVLEAPDNAQHWGVQQTKALEPVLRDAIANDKGFEFFLDEGHRTIKLTVPPKE